MNSSDTNKKGFTLLELLIVIAIIAVLSILLIIVLDPSETLKRARDSQRVSDLNTMKTAIGIYLTSTSSPQLGGASANICIGANGAGAIAYSYPDNAVALPVCTNGATTPLGADSASSSFVASDCFEGASTTYTAINGTGWIPINFLALSGGSPISNIPVDPVNTIATLTAPSSTDYVYRYICQSQTSAPTKPAHAYQMAATLESALYGPSNTTGGLDLKDGSPNTAYYMAGSDAYLFPATSTTF